MFLLTATQEDAASRMDDCQAATINSSLTSIATCNHNRTGSILNTEITMCLGSVHALGHNILSYKFVTVRLLWEEIWLQVSQQASHSEGDIRSYKPAATQEQHEATERPMSRCKEASAAKQTIVCYKRGKNHMPFFTLTSLEPLELPKQFKSD